MEISHAVAALGALAQQTRLRVFRLLITEGAKGLPATEIAARLGVRRNLMSAHLRALHQAGLSISRREGRQIYHAVDVAAVRHLLTFLVQDCCQGNADQCASLLNDILPLTGCKGEASMGQELLN
ncbi:putative transcriptional regulatory protein, ArsR family protein [Parvularcula bermudensis HTCC2503]|uniref:Putative transcriptional regulatory protein, ArsR family protein n=2 Tax=Parvularcula TaxID=208215 RepID=E0TCU6_PARBH|nr:putative transcriptional regulatory protein, ArsR family protein [Parvularcula bermudensis HTCC2503]